MNDIEVFLKTPHPKQQEFLDNRKRFNVLKCGRRFGKTEIAQELISEIIQDGGICAYFSPTYKDLYEVWQQSLHVFYEIIESKSETVKQIIFKGGAKLDMWSMEDPNSGRGRKYHRVIIDECEKAGKFKEAWQRSIRATLTDFKGDAYLLSTPQFGPTFFKELAKMQDKSNRWKTFIYTTYDNPHIDPNEIEDAKGELPDPVFRCEYLAEDLDGMAVNPFAHQFDRKYHVSREAVETPGKQLFISIDFNRTPFAVTFWHFWQDTKGYHLWGIDEAEIEYGSIPAMNKLIQDRYSNRLHHCILTGDKMGDQGNLILADYSSNYMEMAKGLHLGEHQLKLPANPKHKNSRTDVNKILWEAKKPNPVFDFKMNPDTMPLTIRDFELVQCDANEQIIKANRKDISQRGDYLDCSRYIINLCFKEILMNFRK